MKQIFKYPIPESFSNETRFTLDLPESAVLLKVAVQKTTPTLWYEVNLDHKLKTRTFEIVRTGDNVPDSFKHVGTYLTQTGRYVFHVYEVF